MHHATVALGYDLTKERKRESKREKAKAKGRKSQQTEFSVDAPSDNSTCFIWGFEAV